ncbi:hypothetical protein J2W83_004468 [Pseudomonas hunanensis]|uniref:Uncharacterized protein n=1 Tax=Pseudomonas hunanensis TaxID=1247546 RepID=A0ACC6K8T0_9PSED|nr:hypothetical protein [Pseudomonas hunanensis]
MLNWQFFRASLQMIAVYDRQNAGMFLITEPIRFVSLEIPNGAATFRRGKDRPSGPTGPE